LLAVIVMLTTTAAARAQESSSGEGETPKTYYDLRRSNDRTTRLNAERYLMLVTLQEWSDVTGKSKVMAKYLEHDPDFAWVKLQAVREQDGKRVAKEITVPLEKLSKKSQSRVRQIAKLQEKLDELLAGTDDAQGAPSQDPGAPMLDEQGVEPGSNPALGPEAPPAASPPVPAAEPVAEPFSPDPLGFAEMDLGPPPTQGDLPADALPGVPFAPPGALSEPSDPTAAPQGSDNPPDQPPAAEIPTDLPLAAETPADPPPATETPTNVPPATDTQADPPPATDNPSGALSAPSTPPSPDADHPTSPVALKIAFRDAYTLGQKDKMVKLIYWGDSTEANRALTRASIVDGAGTMEVTGIRIETKLDAEERPDYKWTFSPTHMFHLRLENSRTEEFGSISWPYGEIDGKYYLGAWDADQAGAIPP
jgi:hypothetical protein